MLYLEDYLELIEHLPQELRDRFTDIRERDLQVHNSTEQLKEKVKQFFAEAKRLKPEQRQCDYEKLINEYQVTKKYADDKVHIAAQMHEIMIKLVQRLDTELEKFKLELEADHAGITEELEKRSLELDADSRLDDLINNHLNNNNHGSTTTTLNTTNTTATPAATTATTKTPSGIKDRRRSEHKHRHHPYQNNNQDNGYHGRAKLSHHEHNSSFSSKNPLHNNTNHHHHHNNHHQRNGSKSLHSASGSCRQQATASPTQLNNSNAGFSSSISAPASVASSDLLNGGDTETTGHYGNNLSSFGNNPGFKNSSNKNNLQNITANIPFSQQHSALSAALASTTTPQLNSVSALAMMNATSVHNKISTNNTLKGNDLIDPNSPLVRHNPIAAAASQAIAATQQLQQGRRTPSLKASFAAISAAGLGPLDSLANKQDALVGNNRNALAPMAPDQQAFRYNQYGKLNSNGNSSPLYISVTKSGRPSKRPRHHASHLYPDESPTSISSDNSVFENSESLSSTDFIETGTTTFGSNSPSSLDFATNAAQGNTTLYHRDETKYCVCRQISYGEMVACDNDECEIEWFHYDCVGITQPPKGKWFCPDCTRKMTGHQQQQQQQQQQHLHPSQPPSQKKRGRKEKSLFNLVNNSLDAATVRAKDRAV